MDNFSLWCLLPLLTAILGWLFRHWTCKCNHDDHNEKIDNLSQENAKLKADLEAALSKTSDTGELDLLKSQNTKLQTDLNAALSSNTDTSELESLKNQNSKLQADLEASISNNSKLKNDLNLCLASKESLASAASNLGIANSLTGSTSSEPELVFDAAAAKLALGKKIVGDDLKIIEGIGPKIAQLFNDNGVSTWYQLSKTSVERCQEILNIGGKRYEIHNPGTWPKQSGLAFEGKWKELNDLQDYLDGGVEPK